MKREKTQNASKKKTLMTKQQHHKKGDGEGNMPLWLTQNQCEEKNKT